MSTPETPNLRGVFRFVARLHTLSKRGMRAALANEPKCRYGMLQHLYNLIEQHGYDGAIYVSDIARYMHQPMPAVSRGCVPWSRTATLPARQTLATAEKRWCASPRKGSAPAVQTSRP